MSDVKNLAQTIMDKQRRYRHEARSKIWKPTLTPATDLGYECERRIVYHRLYPEDATPISEELASIFEEGNLHQTATRVELAALGYEVLEAERNFRDERLEITGSIDGKLQVGDNHRKRVPLEIKSYYGDGPVDEETWKNSDSSIMQRYYAQLQTYMFLTNEEDAIALFKNKQTGLYSCVAVRLDYEYAEGLLKKAERVRDAIALIKKEVNNDKRLQLLPDRIADRSKCWGCPWKDTLCLPAEAPVDPLLLSKDNELLAELTERANLDQGRKRYKTLDDKIKDRFKLTPGERFVVGESFLISKKKHGKGTRIVIEKLGENDE